MFKKLLILTLSIFFLTLNANSASDGELTLNKDEEKKQIKDCFEKLNRATFSFNQGLDKAIIKPLAKGYRKLPDPIQKGTTNAVKNLSNLIHLVFNNGCHESVGGQPTVASKFRLSNIAKSIGYKFSETVSDKKNLKKIIDFQ